MSVAPPATVAPELDFRVEAVEPAEHAAVPTLRFRLAIDAGGAQVRSLALNTQLRIAATRRAYDGGERVRLYDLFGAPEGWGRTLRSLLWAQVTTNVRGFVGSTTAELLVPCTYDFDVVATKYLHALGGGDVPLELLFSGTVFFAAGDGRLQAAQIPWDREARCAMPVRVWRDALERAFPGSAWVRVERETFDRLHAFRSAHGLLSWDAALDELLRHTE